MRRTTLVSIVLILLSPVAHAGTGTSDAAPLGISGTYLVGAGQQFTSLTNSGGVFEFINSGTLAGDTTVEITSDLTAETGAHALNQWPEQGVGGYTLTIKPSGAPRVVSGETTLIKLNGADRVRIDGSLTAPSGTDRSLTIARTTLGGIALVWIASPDAANGALQNVVQNCNISGSSGIGNGSVGILAAGATGAFTTPGAPNSNNTIRNNQIQGLAYGLYIQGAVAGDSNWLVTENTLTGQARIGISIRNAQSFQISRNVISGIATDDSGSVTGIDISTGSSGGAIEGNTIAGVSQLNNSTFGRTPALGIRVGTGTGTSGFTITNNSVRSIFGFGTVLGLAIGYTNSADGVSIQHNSISLMSFSGVEGRLRASFYVGSMATALDVRDNIFHNSNVNAVYSTYAIFSSAPASAFTAINANSYFATGTGAVLGYLGGNRTNMSEWKAATGQDADSLDPAVDPKFSSSTNLQPLFGSPVINAGKPVGVLTDITGAPRSVTTPSIGAWENPTCNASGDCDDGDACTVGTCAFNSVPHCEFAPAPANTPCGDPDASACNAADSCNETGSCIDRKKPANSVCLPGDASGCNPSDICDGINTACSPRYEAAFTSCGDPDATVCNAADSCDATGHCVDRKQPANVVCLPAAGDCDADDVCDGVSNSCAPSYQGSTVECRASTDVCDPPELCSGAGTSCPADVVGVSASVGNSVRVSHNHATDESTVMWSESLPGPFNVYRGTRSSGGPWVYNHSCQVAGLSAQSTTATATPATSEMFYFLVSRDAGTCPESSLGSDSAGSARPNAAPCSSP